MGSRILVIEDEPGIADYLVRGLQEEGYTVGHAPDGLKGWKLLQAEPWDVILLDWTIPEIDGLELLTRFRQINAVTPVLFLTARDSISDRVSGLNAGAEDYLCKPFAFEELLARIGSLLRRRLVTAVSIISHGDVSATVAAIRELEALSERQRDEMGTRATRVIAESFSANLLRERFCDILIAATAGDIYDRHK